jgi:hypothetical protein
MIVTSLLLLVPLATQPAPGPLCTESRQCRELALAAADRGEFELFHDLAWRAVQTGPKQDASLMYLLARAQALSGRSHDALVMLQRLADMGVATDAETNPDFSRTRDLPGWPDVAARIARVNNPNAPIVAAPPASRAASKAAPPVVTPTPPAATAPPPSSAAASKPGLVSAAPAAAAPAPTPEAVRFPATHFVLGGLAYDAVSDRFLFGDRVGRKLIVVAKGSNHATDFVRADSAGFQEISAVEIDPKRGDLWVASTIPADGAGTVHKLQLVSGRPLKSFPVAADLGKVTLVDLAVTPGGVVLVLDSAGSQLLMLRPGATALERVAQIDAADLTSVAVGEDEATAYVAHRDGISRIDLRAKTVGRVTAAKTVSLEHVERIRWTKRALIGVRVEDDGSRHVVRFDLNVSGRGVTRATPLEMSVVTSKPLFATVSGDELYLTDGSSRASDGSAGDMVTYRIRLR